MPHAETPELELVAVDVAHEANPSFVVVRDVHWRVHAGEWWVVGASPGGGKTALLTTAAGLSPPARGVLRVLGCEVAGASEPEKAQLRRRVGFVFEQGGRLLHRLSVAENVALPLRYHENLGAAEARERVEALLDAAGLRAYADRPPSRLAPPLQQRVALLRALTGPVRLLFLDNPLGGLAPSGVRWWLRFLGELRAAHAARGEPLSVIASGYDFSAWSDVADRFAVLRDERFTVLEGRDAVAAHREESGADAAQGGAL